MPTLRLVYRARATVPPRDSASLFLSSKDLSRRYFPSRGVLYSFFIHAVVFLAMLLHPVMRILPMPEVPRPVERPPHIVFIEPKMIMYLPLIGGGSQGMGFPGGGSRSGRSGRPGGSAPGRAGAPAPSRKGLSYPGPQHVVSDVPEPTNTIQTLLQPGLENPPTLLPPMALPNFVQMADAGPAPKPEPAEPKPVEPLVPPVEPLLPPVAIASPPVEGPKLLLPQPRPPEPVPEPPARPRRPEEQAKIEPPPTTFEKPKEPPSLETAPLPSRGTDLRNVLALTPMPAMRELPVEIPVGEARGRFVMSPEANVDPSETEPGSKLGSPTATALPSEAANAVPAKEKSPPSVDTGAGSAGSGTGTGPGAGTGSGRGAGSGSGAGTGGGAGSGTGTGGSGSGSGAGPGTGAGAGTGSGTGTGTGKGTGTGTGSGSGSGAGSGPGKGPFAGITVVGGVGPTGSAANSTSRIRPAPRPLQKGSYGLTVVSTEASGGGLPFSGVFSHEQIYTVYLDMRRTETDAAPSWTLEFALLQGTGAPATPAEGAGPGQQGLVLPFPAVKEPPVLPAELVLKYFRKMVIVYGIINPEGKMEQMSVKDSPDPLLNEPVLNALRKWVFRPARVNGAPVGAKVLMGIPLWLPE